MNPTNNRFRRPAPGYGQYSPFIDDEENPVARYGPPDLASMPNTAGSSNQGIGAPNMPPPVDPTIPKQRRPNAAAPSLASAMPAPQPYTPSVPSGATSKPAGTLSAPGGMTISPAQRTNFVNDILRGSISDMRVQNTPAVGGAPGQEDPQPAPETPTGAETAAPADPDSEWIAGLYQKYLGRVGTPEEIANWKRELQRRRPGGPTARAYIESAISNSQEAREFQQRNPNTNTDTAETPATETPAQEAPPATGGGRFAGEADPSWFTGFDLGKDYEATSAKGTFMKAAEAAGIDPTGFSKEQAQAWFLEHIKPRLEAAGFQVDEVIGDRAFVRTHENPDGEWVDYMKAAGGGNAQFAWQSDMDSGGTAGGPPGDGPNEMDFWGATQGIDPRAWSKAQAESWFKQNVQPGLERAGRRVEWVIGDTAKIDGVEYDFLQGADSGNAAFQWTVKSGQGGRSYGGNQVGDQIGGDGLSSYDQDPFLELFQDPYYKKIIEDFMRWAQDQQTQSARRA